MAERVDKKAEISIIGRYFNLDIEFIPGVKGTDVAIVKEEGRLQNELGCHRAHTNIWLKMVQEDISSALIFEDDNDFDVDIRHQLGLVQDDQATVTANRDDPWNVPNWDMLWLGTCQEGAWPDDRRKEFMTYRDPTLVGAGNVLHRQSIWGFLQELNITYPEEDSMAHLRSRVIQRARMGMCLSGYVLSNRGAMRLLYDVTHSDWKPVDNIVADIAREGKIKAYSFSPPFFSQYRYNYRDRDSDIGVKPGADDWRRPRLPGKEGKALSIKNSAKANLRKLLAEM